MKRLKNLETILQNVMYIDVVKFIKEIKQLKIILKNKEYNPINNKRIRNLEKKIRKSALKFEIRKKSLPRIKYNSDLPIIKKKHKIINAIKNNPVVIISGETGSGKTTQIPKFCIEAKRGIAGKIGCTQPRRIAAISVAARIANELEVENKNFVGYKIRFDDKDFPDSIIKIMTDGILLAETQKDPFLNEYDTIIIDEAHERSLNIDFALGLFRNLLKKRTNLKIIITSATIDTEKFSKAFNMAPVIEVLGRTYPVEVKYGLPKDLTSKVNGISTRQVSDNKIPNDDQGYIEDVLDAIDHIYKEFSNGDILIFLPTQQDIIETIQLIKARKYLKTIILPLFARLSAKDQAKIFYRTNERKIIVSTNIAETSLTIPRIKYVIDSGLARIPHYSPKNRTKALPVKPISISSANQRKGRCGRVESGICIRLYDESDFNSRPFFTLPEILRSNLSEVIIRMISLKLGEISSFPFIDPPSFSSIKDGFNTLLELGAIKKNNKKEYILTKKGRIMANLPIDPKLSRILLEANKRNCLKQAVIIVSALCISDPRQYNPQEKNEKKNQKHAQFYDPSSDFITFLNIWNLFKHAEKLLKTRTKLRKFCKNNFLSFKRIREWSDIQRQINSILKEHGIKENINNTNGYKGTKGLKKKEYKIGGDLYTRLHKSILCGYLSNIARKKEKNIFYGGKGKKVIIFPGSGLFNKAGTWIVAAEFMSTTRLFARTVANIDCNWLEKIGKNLCTYTWSLPLWKKKRGEVVAKEKVSLFGLVIVEQRHVSYGRINPEEAGEIFIREALVNRNIVKNFPFMDYNQKLIDKLKEMEDKTRKMDVVVTQDDIYLFYKKRLKKDFFNIKTFAKYLKDKQDDCFLKMTVKDLQKKIPDEIELLKYPDFLDMGGAKFKLEYAFNIGNKKDGVTIKVPESSANCINSQTLERLVPGLFKDKITALIKNLPKKYRKKMVPVSEKAEIIATHMDRKKKEQKEKSFFSELSDFIKQKFNIDIPASLWSEKNLEEYLKMGISIRDKKDQEITFSRKKSLLKNFYKKKPLISIAFKNAKNNIEKDNIKKWNFKDIPDFFSIKEKNDISYKVFPGLLKQDNNLCLRIFRSENAALKSHINGIETLFYLCYEKDFKLLKKDFKTSKQLQKFSRFFGGQQKFTENLLKCFKKDLFAKNIRNKQEFYDYGDKIISTFYNSSKNFIKLIIEICREYEKTHLCLKSISLKNINRPVILDLMEKLKNDMMSLVPENFPVIYNIDKIPSLKKYIHGIRIRAERGWVEPLKDMKKQKHIEKYKIKLKQMLRDFDQDSSIKKTQTIENFFWMLEEYKISIFAQELKTSIKISHKKLDDICNKIERII
ncbi:MAG: ATP-dependent RNA helicase HrpA [Desulfobacteraceae bacterium 4572_130]|nr:MAG: ATP-dependent RNA helicase HrpA [Desulfobacteraceae bacterium 4572_130]